MKTWFVSACMLCLAGTSMAQLTLSASESVNASGTGVNWPRVTLNGNGEPVVIYGGAGGPMLMKNARFGGSFGTPAMLPPAGVDSYVQDWTGPEITAKGNDIAVIYSINNFNAGINYIQLSTDGGMSFGDTVRVQDLGDDKGRYPSLIFLSNGNIAATYMRFKPGFIEPKYKVTISTDMGQTWNPDITASTSVNSEPCDCCPPGLGTDGLRLVLGYRNNTSNLRDIFAALSYDNGASFPLVYDVDSTNWYSGFCPSTGPSLHINGDSLYTAWASGFSGSNKVYISSTLVDAGTNLYFSILPNPGSSYVASDPIMAGNGDTIGVIWEETFNGATNLMFSYSLGGITQLGAAQNLTASLNGNQKNPHMVYRNGVWHVVCTDQGESNIKYFTVALPGSSGTGEEFQAIVSVYPNPAGDWIQWNAGGEITGWQMIDETGKVIRSVSGLTSIAGNESVRELPEGNYFFRWQYAGGGERTIPFIKAE